MNQLREIVKKIDYGILTPEEAVIELITWSNTRCSNKWLLTAELITEISSILIKQHGTARIFCNVYLQFTPSYLSNLKKGKKQRVTRKVILLCEILEIKISEYTII